MWRNRLTRALPVSEFGITAHITRRIARSQNWIDRLSDSRVKTKFRIVATDFTIDPQHQTRENIVLSDDAPPSHQRVPPPSAAIDPFDEFLCSTDRGRTDFITHRLWRVLGRSVFVVRDRSPEKANVGIVGIADVHRYIDVEAGEIGVGVEQIEQVAPADNLAASRLRWANVSEIGRAAGRQGFKDSARRGEFVGLIRLRLLCRQIYPKYTRAGFPAFAISVASPETLHH